MQLFLTEELREDLLFDHIHKRNTAELFAFLP